VADQDGRALARHPGEVWQLELDLAALSTMERVWRLGECGSHARRDDGRKRPIQHRFDNRSRPCLGRGRKGGIRQRGLGRSRGGFTSKIHCLADARGRPIAFHITPGETHDCQAYKALIDLPERPPDAFLGDMAFDSNEIRDDLAERGIEAVIPSKSNRKVPIPYDKAKYRDRNCIERFFGHLKINRALATRYDQLAETFLATIFIASARYWIKFVHAA
jgi:transposase